MTKVRIGQFYKLERIVTVKNNARVCHLMKLDRKYVGGIREFLDSEIDGSGWPAVATASAPGLAQIFRRDSIERD